MFLDGSRCTDAVVERCVLHAFHNSRATRINFSRIAASEGSRNGRSVVHPAFQFELSNDLVFAVWFRPALGDLVSSHVGFVEIVDKIDGKLDQEVALHLGVVGIVNPIVKVRLRSKPQHGVSTVLDPKRLFPLFHHNSTKGNSRQHVSLFANELGLGKIGSLCPLYLMGNHSAIRIALTFVVFIIPIVVAAGGRYNLTVIYSVPVRLVVRRIIVVGIRRLQSLVWISLMWLSRNDLSFI